ncbi:tripartite motif-containing protein 2-like isoform X3 [Lingula anatina]|uniref:Tripartite motif-containing protein 2-like isoform X3 n=1 Tax=Lingula anatina TaxID=7574 RepID=A0A1S3JQ25_LINAN|nr:tripartite motif-containing protein 2-like isoform X3 [Lingula anatina]|eukprot:XP_013412483.1 tripartite motif-containing protein 2-like isoform X3 [Lingula anatina]
MDIYGGRTGHQGQYRRKRCGIVAWVTEVVMATVNSTRMASNINVVKQIHKQFLSCGICLQQYTNPKVLPCLHTFCELCLYDYIPLESLSVSCPLCRQQSILPQEGVSGLQSNFLINNLMEMLENPQLCTSCDSGAVAKTKCTNCNHSLCESCSQLHKQDVDLQTHDLVSLDKLSPSESKEGMLPQLVCPNHQGELLKFYCASCDTAVCEECTALEHHDHRITTMEDAIQEHQSALRNLIHNAQARIPVIEDAITVVSSVSTALCDKFKEAEMQISDAFDALNELIDQRRNKLLSDLESTHKVKQATLHSQKQTLLDILTNINDCCQLTEKALTHGSETDILLMRKEMTAKLSDLSALEVQCMPEENPSLSFVDCNFSDVAEVVEKVGKVETNSAVAFETTASGEGLRRCYTGKKAMLSVTTKNRHGELLKVGHCSLTAQITSTNGEVFTPTVIDQNNGTYDLTYIVPSDGSYQLEIRLYGQQIKGSPFSVQAYPPPASGERPLSASKIPKTLAVKQKGTKRPPSSKSSNRRSNPIDDDLILRVGAKGRNRGEFSNPQGLCTTPKGLIIVADSNNQYMQVFTNSGDFKMKFGVRGRSPGQVQRPTGVAVSANGNYLVADYDNKWVSIYSPDGKYLNKIGTGKLIGPKGVAVDNNGHIIVVDNKGSSIYIFQSNGKLLHKFGTRGNEENQFAGPHYVAVNSNNDIIISDFHNHCIKVFNCEGTFLFSFGSNGEGMGQFNAPTGVAVDKQGNIIVADWGNSRLQVFDQNGSFLAFVNTQTDPLYGPQGVAVTSDGHVVVSDSGNHCFKIYKYLQ